MYFCVCMSVCLFVFLCEQGSVETEYDSLAEAVEKRVIVVVVLVAVTKAGGGNG